MEWIIIALVIIAVLAFVLTRRPKDAKPPVSFSPGASGSEDEITRLIASDQKILAIKKLRELRPGLSLAEAKHQVEHWDLPSVKEALHAPLPGIPADAAPEIDALLAAGQPIRAIKLLRERTGLGLREAKAVIDDYMRH